MVVKKDGRREKFERQKVLSGLLRACENDLFRSANSNRSSTRPKASVIDSPERERKTGE